MKGCDWPGLSGVSITAPGTDLGFLVDSQVEGSSPELNVFMTQSRMELLLLHTAEQGVRVTAYR